MKPRWSLLAALLIAVAAIAGPVWLLSKAAIHPGDVPDRETLAQLQSIADQACSCTRKRGTEAGRAPCWAEFEEAIAPYSASSMSTACGPMSGSWRCFGKDCAESVSVGRAGGACSGEEEDVLVAIWAHEGGDQSDAGWNRGLAALDRATEAFRRGEKVTKPAVPQGTELGC